VADPTSSVRRLLQAMPKAELHLHIDGSLRPRTAIELARRHGIDAPTTWDGMFRALVAPALPGSQSELLRAFDLPIAIMQHRDSLERITAELVEDKAADRVRYMELKWAPGFHLREGLTLHEVIDAVCTGAAEAAQRCGVEVRLTVVGVRAATPEENVEVAHAAVAFRDRGVTGWDLAGYEARHPDPTPHAPAFEVARAGGLGITVHAGELVDDGSLVARALTLRPQRVAHGPWSIADPAVLQQLVHEGITLDLCPTSNVQAGTVPSFAEHPLARLLRAGVPVSINTDDVTVSDITLSEELESCVRELGLTLPEIWHCQLHALRAAFVDEPTRVRLLDDFASWAADVPELSPAGAG
jgi:adenosine deaminase